MLGLSDRECCLYADIGESTLYDYCKENPDFSERKEALKEVRFPDISDTLKRGSSDEAAWDERKIKAKLYLGLYRRLDGFTHF